MVRQLAVLTGLVAAAGGCVTLPGQTSPDPTAALKQAVKQTNARSAENLGSLIDGLYLKLLGRPADAGERAGWVGLLRGGGTVEQAVIVLVTSDEYARSAGGDGAYLRSVYRGLLGREPFDYESSALLAALPSVGRARVAEVIVKSAEFRANVVRRLYGLPNSSPVAAAFPALLPGTVPPTPEAVSAWAAADLDLLGVEAAIAASPPPEPAKAVAVPPAPVR
jgi:hypothetical protein